jgi:hypothetical protein
MFTGRKLALTLAFTVLIALAAGVSCKDFFQPNALVSVSIQPPSPQVEVGQTSSLQAWGTYQDNSRSQITSGVAWTSSDNTTVLIDPKSGQITGENAGGTATITAAAQGLSATATATAYLGNVSNLVICTGTFDTGSCPAATWSISGSAGGHQDYYLRGSSNGKDVDLTTVATWTVTPTTTQGAVTCSATTSPAVCTVDPQTLPVNTTYVITVVYPGLSAVTANISVTQ